MHLDGATLFAPEALFHELHPEITSFDYSWSIVNDAKKTDYVGAELKNIVASHSNIALDEINTVIEYEEISAFDNRHLCLYGFFDSPNINRYTREIQEHTEE